MRLFPSASEKHTLPCRTTGEKRAGRQLSLIWRVWCSRDCTGPDHALHSTKNNYHRKIIKHYAKRSNYAWDAVILRNFGVLFYEPRSNFNTRNTPLKSILNGVLHAACINFPNHAVINAFHSAWQILLTYSTKMRFVLHNIYSKRAQYQSELPAGFETTF